MGPEGGQAWEAGSGLGLTEDHRKMLRPPSRMRIPGCGPPSWGPRCFIISLQCEHCTCLTAPRKPVCGKPAFPKLVLPLSCVADRKLGTQSGLSHLPFLSYWQLQPQLQLWDTGNDPRTPVVEGRKGIFKSDQAVGVS